MKLQVTVSGDEIQSVIGNYLQEKFKHLVTRDDQRVEARRVGDYPMDIVFDINVVFMGTID